jgi:hypothetical protein
MNGGIVCVEMNKLRCYFYLHVRRKNGRGGEMENGVGLFILF